VISGTCIIRGVTIDRDRDSAAQRGTWLGVKPLGAPRESEPEVCHYALTWTTERAVAVCGEVITHPAVIEGMPPDRACHSRCDEITRAGAAGPR
jgi:hypothetical protein